MYWCIRDGPADSHSCFRDNASYALVDKSSGMELSISCAALLYRVAGLESVWRLYLYSGVVQDMPVVYLGFPCQIDGISLSSEAGWGNSCKDWQVGHRSGFQAASYGSEGVVNYSVNFFDMWAPTPDWGTVFSC